MRSGTSIGANIAESEFLISRKEFIPKTQIALKECAETHYWLELLYDTDLINEKEFMSIDADCIELLKILTSVIKKLKQ